MNESRITKTKSLWSQYLTLQSEALTKGQERISRVIAAVQAISSATDIRMLIDLHKKEWTEPYDFTFQPTLLWKDNDQMVDSEQAKVLIVNKLGKYQDRLVEVEREIEGKQKEIEGLRNLFSAYTKNPTTGNAEDVGENIIETQRALSILEMTKSKYETSVAVSRRVVGEVSIRRHNLMKSSFAMPATCDYCQEKIWGVSNTTGFQCKDCGYNCHAKCELKIPPICTSVKPATRENSSSKKSKTLAAIEQQPSSAGCASWSVNSLSQSPHGSKCTLFEIIILESI